MKHLFFSFEGRIGRQTYWLSTLALLIPAVAAMVMTESKGADFQMLGWIILAGVSWSWLALSVKRWHDRNKSGWWLLLSFIPYIGPIWNFVELGCLAGTAGMNRFGPDPLPSQTGTTSAPPQTANPSLHHPPPLSVSPVTSSASLKRKSLLKQPPKPKKQPSVAVTASGQPKQRKGVAKEAATSSASTPIIGPGGIQQMIKAAGASLDVWPPQELPGPLTIERPITVDFRNSTLWATHGPVLTVKGPGICIRNACVEVTGNASSTDHSVTAIRVVGRAQVTFENVTINGFVEGVPGEDGLWQMPRSLSLGTLAAGEAHEFRLRVTVPTDCKLVADERGIAVSPQNLSAGEHEVVLRFESGLNGPYSARLSTVTKSFRRCIPLSAYFCDANQAPAAIKGNGQLIWPPADHQATQETPEEHASAERDSSLSQATVQAGSSEDKRENDPSDGTIRPKRYTRPAIPNWAGGAASKKYDSNPIQPQSPPTEEAQEQQGQENVVIEPAAPGEATESKRIPGKPGKAFGL